MREESHLDDMRSAIRGDFERLARRRGGQDLMREPEEAELAHPDSQGAEPEPELDPVQAAPVETVPEVDLTVEPEPEPLVEPEVEDEHEEPLRRSFLDRLLGR